MLVSKKLLLCFVNELSTTRNPTLNSAPGPRAAACVMILRIWARESPRVLQQLCYSEPQDLLNPMQSKNELHEPGPKAFLFISTFTHVMKSNLISFCIVDPIAHEDVQNNNL